MVNWRPSLVYDTVTLSPGLLLPIAADKSAKESILELSILVIISPFLIPASSAPDTPPGCPTGAADGPYR